MTSHRLSISVVLSFLMLLAQGAFAQGPPNIIWENDEHVYSVHGIAYSDDGSLVVSGAEYQDSKFKVWSAADGTPLGTYSVHPHSIISLDITPDKSKVAVGYIVSGYPPGGVAGLWDRELGQELWTSGGCHVDLSPDGSLLASGGGGVNRYLAITRVSDGQELHSVYTGSYILDVAYSPDGLVVATAGSDNDVKLWDPLNGSLIRVLSDHSDDVSALAFSPYGDILASGAGGWDDVSDSSIKLWRVSDGELLDTLDGHGDWVYALAFAPSGHVLLSSGRSGSAGKIKYWNLAQGETFQYHDASAMDLAFSPDGQYFAYGSAYGDVVLAASNISTAAESGFTGTRIFNAPSPNPFRSNTTFSFQLEQSGSVRLSIHDAQGRRIATLLDGSRAAGAHSLVWDGRSEGGSRVIPGVYFARLESPGGVSGRKVVFLR